LNRRRMFCPPFGNRSFHAACRGCSFRSISRPTSCLKVPRAIGTGRGESCNCLRNSKPATISNETLHFISTLFLLQCVDMLNEIRE
jgi:hypothetical protein